MWRILLGGRLENLTYSNSQPPKLKKSWFTAIAVGSLIVFVYALCQLGNSTDNTKTIAVTINGLTETYTTKSITVDGLVRELGLVDPIVSIAPARASALANIDQVAITTKPAPRNTDVATNMQMTIQKVQAELKKKEEALVVPKSQIREGYASWYKFGNGMNTASREFPRGTKIRVIAINSGKYIDVVVNDFGPEDWTGVSLDLNKPAFAKLAPIGAGIIQVRYYKI